jgi:hypothetical protein
MALSDTAIRKAKAEAHPYRMSDGAGLFLFITPPGGKLWRWKYRFEGKENSWRWVNTQTFHLHKRVIGIAKPANY